MIEDYQAKRRRTRRLSRLLLVAGLVLALVAAVSTYLFATTPAAGPVAVERTESVVVATHDIAPRTTLTSGDLKLVRTVKELVPPGALPGPEAAIGRVATVAIATGEILLQSKFQAVDGFGFSVFPPGQQPTGSAPEFRAMSISVPDAQAVGGAVQPGDIVDIVFALTFEPARLGLASAAAGASPAPAAAPATERPLTDFAAKITYEKIPVLAKALTTYTIRVDAQQAERIAALSSSGAAIHLLLRAREDTRTTGATGALYSVEAAKLVRAIPTR